VEAVVDASKKYILVADDYPTAIEAIVGLLTDLGYESTTACNG